MPFLALKKPHGQEVSAFQDESDPDKQQGLRGLRVSYTEELNSSMTTWAWKRTLSPGWDQSLADTMVLDFFDPEWKT